MTLEKLTHLSLLRITGEDALPFLQGQLTNDVHQAQGRWQFSAYCDPKGRVLALLRLWRTGDEVFALLNRQTVDATVNRLRMYVLRSNVTIEILPDCQLVGCFNPTEFAQLESASMGDVVALNDDLTALIFNQRYLLVDPSSTLITQAGTTWLEMDIRDGLPDVSANTMALFIPQMLNLDVINGISFKKGCYTGQEIVARMHYLGKLKQRMFLCALSDSLSSIQPADKITLPDSPGSTIGTIVSAVEGSDQVLAVIRIDQLEQPNLTIKERTTAVSITPEQPYQLSEN